MAIHGTLAPLRNRQMRIGSRKENNTRKAQFLGCYCDKLSSRVYLYSMILSRQTIQTLCPNVGRMAHIVYSKDKGLFSTRLVVDLKIACLYAVLFQKWNNRRFSYRRCRLCGARVFPQNVIRFGEVYPFSRLTPSLDMVV